MAFMTLQWACNQHNDVHGLVMGTGAHIGKVLVDTSPSPQTPTSANCLGGREAHSFLNESTREGVHVLPSLQLEPCLHFRWAC